MLIPKMIIPTVCDSPDASSAGISRPKAIVSFTDTGSSPVVSAIKEILRVEPRPTAENNSSNSSK